MSEKKRCGIDGRTAIGSGGHEKIEGKRGHIKYVSIGVYIETRDRRYQNFGSDTDTDTLAASESIPGLIPGLRRVPNRYRD